jgi:alpha-amylase/alpha-mannosidase (GH57 family)
MEKYVCIHGHFYQPPRENPWLEAIEIQDSAYPYHDWNERINAECYAPNSAARNLDSEGRILDIVSNYARISFNFGPTLLSWMENNKPEIHQALLESDRQSIEWRSGHGNAIAQPYNHLIMPLANTRDKRTQVIWGVRDFEYRFKRFPEGMWLPETAVDIETLEILAEFGIKFTILAPRQASLTRKIGISRWRDVSDSRIDPTRAYLCRLPSGRTINIFFYDGPISQAVAFENLLKSGEEFAHRLLSGFSDARNWPQILSIATDGETYGHHHRFGDMALTYALNYIETNGMARLTNYGEYLEKHPPTYEVQIFENSSWSCIHGIERWRSDCGCNSGGHSGWNQAWRKPLRDALDWLRGRLSFIYETLARQYLKDPWKARDDYIYVALDRSEESMRRFLIEHSLKNLSIEERVNVLKLLEMQRHAMLMYTSCGWFFDELSGIETVQVMQYASRAIQLSDDLYKNGLEDTFKMRLSMVKSNIPEYENGAKIFDRFVKLAMIDLKKVTAHYAVSSLFEEYIDETAIYSYSIRKEDYQKIEAGNTKLAVGKVSVSSKITRETEKISFCVLHFNGHAFNGGVRTFLGPEAYQSMKNEIITTFKRGDFILNDILRLMDNYFGMHNYSLLDLFRDQQRAILNVLISRTLEEFVDSYRQIYENNKTLMGFLKEMGMPVKKAFLAAAEFTLNADIKEALLEENIDVDRIQNLIIEMKNWEVSIDSVDIEFMIRGKLEMLIETLYKNPSDFALILYIQRILELLKSLPIEVNYWQTQNIYYKIANTSYRDFLLKSQQGDENAKRWVATFKYIGEMLFFNISSVLPAY